MGPDRNTHIRNFSILILIAVAVWQLPGGGTATSVIQNILSVAFAGGLVFFGYRMYMEHRSSIFMLEDKTRALMYACGVLAAFALIATSELWAQGGIGVLIWLALLGLATYGLVAVYRTSREY